MSIKRVFDIVFSLTALIWLAPLLLLISILIKITSHGPVFFIQKRVGLNNGDFNIIKFRTMKQNPSNEGFLTIGNDDSRITKIGLFLRKFKLDELPQLINVLKGDMSMVGPRPELRYFVNLYSKEDLEVLKVKPGITGLASIKYSNEAELLKSAKNPEAFYLNEILPHKLKLNKQYIKEQSFILDLKLILLTIPKIFSKK